MGGQDPQGFQSHRRYRITAQGRRGNPAPVRAGPRQFSAATNIKKIKRRSNPSIGDAMAKSADLQVGLESAVQFAQVSFEGSARAFVSAELDAWQFPKPGKNAGG